MSYPPSFVVHLVGADEAQQYKQFSSRAEAVAFAQSQIDAHEVNRADIYEVVASSDARKDIQLVKAGGGTLVAPKQRQPTLQEIDQAEYRARVHRLRAERANKPPFKLRIPPERSGR